jgi:non-ribosomal peptide synthetase component E (peptide arylation enzyme)
MGAGRPFAWEKSYPAGVRWDAPIATSTIPELLDRAVAQFGDRAVLEYRDRRIGYRELVASADRAAAAFLRLGTNAPVALYLPNTPYHPVSFFGAMRADKCAALDGRSKPGSIGLPLPGNRGRGGRARRSAARARAR